MATQDSNPGLLSKMVRFVRNTGKDHTDPGSQDSIAASDFGKEALKQLIDAKRHDDGIRRREFRYLRKLRQVAPANRVELSHETSTFRSSLGDSESDAAGRSSTLKKIDEIEAQMSRQWWKSAPTQTTASKAGASPVLSEEVSSTFPATLPSLLDTTAKDPANQLPITTASQEFQATVPGVDPVQVSAGYSVSAHSTFSPSKMVLLDLGQSLADPEMEEAAIRYANGDDLGAEAALQSALQKPDTPPEKSIQWAAALLDLYRCIGQQANFERLAMDLAQRFGRSPPAWRALKGSDAAQAVAGTSNTVPAEQPWDCPALIDQAVVTQLDQLVRLPTVTYVLNWAAANQISPSASVELAALFGRWCQRNLVFRMKSGSTLNQITHNLVPDGDSGVAQHLWQLRFDTLRLLNRPDDYEVAALDFCIAYELSPPAWTEPMCKHASGKGAPVAAEAEQLTASVQLCLTGNILGDVAQWVAQWESLATSGEPLLISCDGLVRIDFSAAGSLLNWVANRSNTEVHIEFHDVPRLVAAFFNLIGINEHARVLTCAH